MNTRTTPKPTWITLYSIGAMGITALFGVPFLNIGAFMQTITMLLIVVILYGTIGMWISANSAALEMEGMGDTDESYTIHWDVAHKPVEVEPTIPEIDRPHPSDHQEAA